MSLLATTASRDSRRQSLEAAYSGYSSLLRCANLPVARTQRLREAAIAPRWLIAAFEAATEVRHRRNIWFSTNMLRPRTSLGHPALRSV